MQALNIQFLALAGLIYAAISLVAAQTCYLPNGQEAYGDIACSNTLPAQCCNGTCLSNGLCFNPSVNLLSRSSCTDATWAADECTDYCKTMNPTNFEVILSCGSGLFCCPPSSSDAPDACCTNSSATFTLPAGNILSADSISVSSAVSVGTSISATGTAQAQNQAIQIAAASSSTSTQTRGPDTTSATGASTTNLGALESGGTSASSFPAASQTSSANTSVQLSTTSSKSTSAVCVKQSTYVGVGVGVPFAVALMIVSFLLYKARKAHERDPIALGAENLKAGSSSLYTVPSRTTTMTRQRPLTPPRIPPRPISRLLPFTDSEITSTGRRF